MYKEKTITLNTTLQHSLDNSHTTQEAEKFTRIERRFTNANLAKLKSKLDSFRRDGADFNSFTLATESHSSKLLGEFLRCVGFPRPGLRWEAHHIISGDHKEARPTRALLADDDIKMRIDDPENGCWMPKTKQDARPTIYPNAVPHSRIHRDRYYDWIFNMLMNAASWEQAKTILNVVRRQLLDGNIKNELLVQDNRRCRIFHMEQEKMKIFKILNDFENFFSFSIENGELFSKMPAFSAKFKGKPIITEWVTPNSEFFQSDNYTSNGVHIPSITTWLLGNLVLNSNAYNKLKTELESYGEFLETNCEGIPYYIFNTLKIIPDDLIDKNKTKEKIESGIYMGLEDLAFKDIDSSDYMIFKTNADKLTYLYCTETFVNLIKTINLTGLKFSENLCSI